MVQAAPEYATHHLAQGATMRKLALAALPGAQNFARGLSGYGRLEMTHGRSSVAVTTGLLVGGVWLPGGEGTAAWPTVLRNAQCPGPLDQMVQMLAVDGAPRDFQ
jgi:hypothetical protein